VEYLTLSISALLANISLACTNLLGTDVLTFCFTVTNNKNQKQNIKVGSDEYKFLIKNMVNY